MSVRRKRRGDSAGNAMQLIAGFESLIAEHEDLTYGLALLFEVLSVVYSRDEVTLDAYRRQHVQLIQEERQTLFRAVELLESVRARPDEAAEVTAFTFAPFRGYPDAEGLGARCKLMVEAYGRVFPDRPRDRLFSAEEALQLVDDAVGLLGERIL